MAASGPDTLDADVTAALAAFLAAKRAELTGMHPALAAVVDEIERRCAEVPGPGPAYAYWAWRGSASPDAPVDDAAARRAVSALELLRVGAVEHSDVPTEAAPGAVPPVGRAILSGDLALIWSAELLTTSGLPEDTLEAIGPVWDALRTRLTAGSYLELLRAAGGLDDGPAESPTGWSLRLGAALAGADAAALAACARIGTLLDEGAEAERIRGAVAAAPLAEEAREALLALSSSGS